MTTLKVEKTTLGELTTLKVEKTKKPPSETMNLQKLHDAKQKRRMLETSQIRRKLTAEITTTKFNSTLIKRILASENRMKIKSQKNVPSKKSLEEEKSKPLKNPRKE
ncbi:hypothetical protein CEXT_172741 [Caerostris extrusa]|uniref:Ribosomal protein L29 n=1 Tax=Caerostris extrusa TaxID=172846 RepID=A0AAV4W518_CAEEX|nr:hypothetical protein CEXT_172741 [Caerostris extrusa]